MRWLLQRVKAFTERFQKPKLDLTGLQGKKPLKVKAKGPMEMNAGTRRTFRGTIRKKE